MTDEEKKDAEVFVPELGKWEIIPPEEVINSLVEGQNVRAWKLPPLSQQNTNIYNLRALAMKDILDLISNATSVIFIKFKG